MSTTVTGPACYELRFQFLFDEGRAYAFPCDEQGRVNIDALSEPARNNYFFARAAVGRDVAVPVVVQAAAWH